MRQAWHTRARTQLYLIHCGPNKPVCLRAIPITHYHLLIPRSFLRHISLDKEKTQSPFLQHNYCTVASTCVGMNTYLSCQFFPCTNRDLIKLNDRLFLYRSVNSLLNGYVVFYQQKWTMDIGSVGVQRCVWVNKGFSNIFVSPIGFRDIFVSPRGS